MCDSKETSQKHTDDKDLKEEAGGDDFEKNIEQKVRGNEILNN